MGTELSAVDRAVEALGRGEPVLVHDFADREGETDLVYPADTVTAADVARLRSDAGGLVCVALADRTADAWDLPFLAEVIEHPATTGRPGYDERSSFSLSVNHRDAYTGVTDEDRALTIAALGEAARDPHGTAFAEQFRAPGHVHLLRAAPTLADRAGHTELGVALAEAAGLPGAVVVCEMLADAGGALPVAAAKGYADRHDIPYVEGADVLAVLG